MDLEYTETTLTMKAQSAVPCAEKMRRHTMHHITDISTTKVVHTGPWLDHHRCVKRANRRQGKRISPRLNTL
jgi:hypothetical protein